MASLDAASLHASANGDQPNPDELVDLLRQERADFRNYRRRVADERAAELDRLRDGLLEPLLPVIDDLDRAFATVPEHLAEDPWVRGIGLTRSKLDELRARLGVERVGSIGDRFDPTRHEALVYEPDPDVPEAILGDVIRPGYATGSRLLRPAQVVVRGPLLNDAQPADDGPPATSTDDEAVGG
jgi:molecular chaperone GrpE